MGWLQEEKGEDWGGLDGYLKTGKSEHSSSDKEKLELAHLDSSRFTRPVKNIVVGFNWLVAV